jgi:hypothetical protein
MNEEHIEQIANEQTRKVLDQPVYSFGLVHPHIKSAIQRAVEPLQKRVSELEEERSAIESVLYEFEQRERGIPQAHIAAELVSELRAKLSRAESSGCSIADSVARKVGNRAAFGLKKYGVTCDRTDLTPLQWLTHLQEELMDAAVYTEKLMRHEPLTNDQQIAQLTKERDELRAMVLGYTIPNELRER